MMKQERLRIRDAGIADLPAIVEIYNSTIPGRMTTADTEPMTVRSKEQWFSEHMPDSRPLWIMEHDEKICGWLSFQSFYGRPAYHRTAEISIYIAQDYRRRGLGRLFLERATEACPKLGIKTLLGFVFGHNAPSLILFHHHGFSDWGVLPRVAELDGVERDLIILGRRVEA